MVVLTNGNVLVFSNLHFDVIATALAQNDHQALLNMKKGIHMECTRTHMTHVEAVAVGMDATRDQVMVVAGQGKNNNLFMRRTRTLDIVAAMDSTRWHQTNKEISQCIQCSYAC
jgi:hypothetical protein